MNYNKKYRISTVKPIEDEYLLVEFEDTKIEHLPAPIRMCKDAPPPPAPSSQSTVTEKNEMIRRKTYKSQISKATFQMTCGEKQLDIPKIDPITSQPITTEPMQTLRSRRYQEDDKYAVICIEDDKEPTISVLDEKWIFTKRSVNQRLAIDVYNTPVVIDEKSKKKRHRGENSEGERNSHTDDMFADDDDEFNPKHRMSQSSESRDESESETSKRKEFVKQLKKEMMKDHQQQEQLKRPLKNAVLPKAKRNSNELKELEEASINILKKEGREMFFDQFKTELLKKTDCLDEEVYDMLSYITQINENGSNTTISLKKVPTKHVQKKKKKVVKKIQQK